MNNAERPRSKGVLCGLPVLELMRQVRAAERVDPRVIKARLAEVAYRIQTDAQAALQDESLNQTQFQEVTDNINAFERKVARLIKERRLTSLNWELPCGPNEKAGLFISERMVTTSSHMEDTTTRGLKDRKVYQFTGRSVVPSLVMHLVMNQSGEGIPVRRFLTHAINKSPLGDL
jgi:hypothetical protein